jgi:hypothetical protein
MERLRKNNVQFRLGERRSDGGDRYAIQTAPGLDLKALPGKV